ncbi:RHS repeat protein, partial [candidate division WOR-3 bacterium]|nr:RHS repeat protein [candidate division WOR-3 bacterium]
MNYQKNLKVYLVLIFSLFCLFHCFTLSAEDPGCEIDLFNERGFLKGNTYASESSGEHISDFNGNLTYSKEVLYYPGRGDLDLHVTINYNGSVNHTIQRYYNDNAPIITMDFPEWILGVNGIAVQVFNFKKKWYRDTTQNYPAFVVEGYDKSNPLKDSGWSLCFLMADGSIEEYISSDVPSHCYWGKYIPTQVENYSFAWQQHTTQNCNQTFKIRRKNGIVITYEEETADFYDRPPEPGDEDNKLFHTYYPISIEDRFGNKISLDYAYVWGSSTLFGRKMITGITDACGRKIKIDIDGITQQTLYTDMYLEPDTSPGDELVTLEFQWDSSYHIHGGDNSVHYLCKTITQKTNYSNSRITSFTHGWGYVKCVRIQSPVTTDYRLFTKRLAIITHSTGSTCLFKYVPADNYIMYWDHLTGKNVIYWSATFRATGREPFVVNMVDTIIKRDSESNIERKVSFSYKWSGENLTGHKPRHKDDYEYYTIKIDSGSTGLRPQGEEYTLMRKDSFCFREYPIKDISNPYSFLQHYKWHTKLIRIVNKNFSPYRFKGYYWDADPHGSGQDKWYDGTFFPDSIRRTRGSSRRFKESYTYDSYGNCSTYIDPMGNEFYYQYYYLDNTDGGNSNDFYIVSKPLKEWIASDSSYGVIRYSYVYQTGQFPRLRLRYKIEKIDDSNDAWTKFENYDNFGNYKKLTDPKSNITEFYYDDIYEDGEWYYSGNHGFWTRKRIIDTPIKFFNDHGDSTKPGLLIKSRDPNGQITRYPEYDWWGRIKEIKKPDDTTPSIKFYYGDDASNIWTKIWRYYSDSNYYTTLYRFDNFDKLYQKNNINTSAYDTLSTEYTHTFMDKTASGTSPKGTKTSISDYDYTKYYKYDAIGRLKEVIQPFEVLPTGEGMRGYSGTD